MPFADEKRRSTSLRWYYNHRKEVSEKVKIKRQDPKYKEKEREQKKRYFSNPDNVAKAYVSQLKYKATHRELINKKRSLYVQKIRKEVLDFYGGKCACCGETENKFLCIDHINGRGAKDTRKTEGGRSWYSYLRKYKPSYVQVLCHNCNMAKGFYGACPHKLEGYAAKAKTSI